MKKSYLVFVSLIITNLIYSQIEKTSDVSDEPNGDWNLQNVTLYNTSEAEIMIRAGDIDNLGFGWPAAFDPFSGNSTPTHAFPYWPEVDDVQGTDEIFVPSSYNGNPPWGQDGYSSDGVAPKSIILNYDLQGLTILGATIQIFVDDFQASWWHADWKVTLDGLDAEFLNTIINSLVQTGPIGKIITAQIPAEFLQYLTDGSLAIKIDDQLTGAGDGYAIDFVKLLINPLGFTYIGTVQGNITDGQTSLDMQNTLITDSYVHDYSNTTGDFQLNGVPAGQVLISASKSGYIQQSVIIDLINGATVTQDFILLVDPNSVNVTFTNGSGFTPNLLKGQNNQVIGRFQLASASDGASLAGVSMLLNGIWRSGASNFKLWKSNDASFSTASDKQLGITLPDDPGVANTLNFIGLSTVIPISQTYFFVTCDLASNADGQIECLFNSYDAITLTGGNFTGSVTNIPLSGSSINLDVDDEYAVTIFERLELMPAYPNPFNPSTTITYGLDSESRVSIEIYDITGQLISTLKNENQTQGWHSTIWNGTDSNNNQVPAGIYLFRITSDNEVRTTKLMLLK